MKFQRKIVVFLVLWMALFYQACSGSHAPSLKDGVAPNLVTNADTPLTIHDASLLIGGPAAQGRVGDILMSNSKIRVLFQKSGKNANITSFGGNIIDADRVRPEGQKGQDRWGSMFPLVNVEWTINNYNFQVLAEGNDGGAQILRAYGVVDVYDYLDLDWIADVASAVLGQQLTFSDRFDDRRDPFNTDSDLRDLNPNVITDYTLEPDSNYVRIDTTFVNPSKHTISLPVGDFLVASTELQRMIPGIGFSPSMTSQIGSNTPGVIFGAFSGGDVSYGYFYDIASFKKPKVKEEDKDEVYQTSSLSYAGVTGVLLGEEFLKILPLGSQSPPDIHFTIPPKSERTITRYFVVGDGSVGSVLDTGLKILKVSTGKVSGQVVLANKAPVAGAIVAVKKQGGATVATYVSDAHGNFSGMLPVGTGLVGQAFGPGQYEVWVEKEGYHENGTVRAGHCAPAQIDLKKSTNAQVTCTLGESGSVKISGGVTDATTGSKIPARLTIVGQDPSPETEGAGTFSDLDVFYKPFGIVDVKYINAKGGIGLSDQTSFPLEPGTYRFFVSHGPEYTMYEKQVTIAAGGGATLDNVTLKKVVDTSGYISADFHVHSSTSPDSAYIPERRALAAEGEGIDVLQSSDHDALTDYGPVVKRLAASGIIKPNSIQTSVGQEITPNQYGHMHAFPLAYNEEDPDHGAIDWSLAPQDEIAPSADYCLSPPQIEAEVLRQPGEKVFQINHISDAGASGLPVGAGWLTTPVYQKTFGVPPFISYADPIERRLAPPNNGPPAPPYTMAQSDLIFDTFTTTELAIDHNLHDDTLWESTLPTWFNFLNLGLTPTATGDSDSHHEISPVLGFPRNYIASKADPADGIGDYGDISLEEYAHSINQHHVIVSAGPFIAMTATNAKGVKAHVGDIIEGNAIILDIEVTAPDWAWFDTIEIYANTEPIPAEDTGRFALRGAAADPVQFAKPYHVPKYVYEPLESFRLADGSLKDWTKKDGKIRAHIELTITVREDTWIVVTVKGTSKTEGYRSLFPFVTDVLADAKQPPANFDPAALDNFHKDPKVSSPAWAFTNPIFIDVDGDADNDGFPFEAKWVRDGFSKMHPYRPPGGK